MAKQTGTKDKTTGNKAGIVPEDRPKGLVGNQWRSTPKQMRFMDNWLHPQSPTFGNAYKSALAAGYSETYATQLASPAINNKWLQEHKRRLILTEEHIRQGISELALNAQDSRSPDDTKLKAYETLAKISGMIDNKSGTTVNIVQPILNGKSANIEPIPPSDVVDVQQ